MAVIGMLGMGYLASVERAEAHHSFRAEFDANDMVTLEGTVVRMEWVNPHAWLTIDVTDEDGKPERWALECGPPNALFRQGWHTRLLLPGMTITATGFRARDGRQVADVQEITLPGGQTLPAGGPGGSAREAVRNNHN